MASSVYADIPQLRELLRDLDAIDEDIGRAVREAIQHASEPILAQAKRNAPYDPTHRGHRHAHSRSSDPGHIRDSLHVRSAPYGAALYTTHPAGAVHHWGGTIAPKGTPFTIRAREFATKAGQQVDITDSVADAIDRLLQQHNL